MSKSVSKGRIAVIIICLLLTVAVVAGTFLVFRPYYYNNIYMAPNPTNLSVYTGGVADAVYGDFYVSPNGSDDNSGSQEYPFATIKKAQEAAKKLDKKYRNHIVIALLAGTYDIGSVKFTEKYSGTESCRIIYAACGDGEVIFSGGAPAGENFTPTDSAVIEINGAKHLSFSNITVDASTGKGIKVKGSNIDFSGCTVKNTADVGIEINGKNISVINCCFTKTGSSAIVAQGGSTKKLTSGNIVISNNLIYSTCVFDNNQPAVILGGVGNSFTNNEIYNMPSSAVYYSGNLNKIEYNYIHNCLLTNDAQAAITSPKGYLNYSNFVRYNCISTLGNGKNTPTAIHATSGSTVRGNMFINVPGICVDLGMNRDINVTNNIIINCRMPIYTDDISNGGLLLNELADSPYKSKEWKEKLPLCSALQTDPVYSAEAEFALNPAGCLIENNIILQGEENIGILSSSIQEYTVTDKNLILHPTKTDIFTDAQKGVYTIDDSVLTSLSIDFSNLPFDSMGRY